MTVAIILFLAGLLWAAVAWKLSLVASFARVCLAVFVLLLTPPAMARILAYLESTEPMSSRCEQSQATAYFLLMGGVYPDFMNMARWSSLMPASLARLEYALEVWERAGLATLYIAASPEEYAATTALLEKFSLTNKTEIVFLSGVSNTQNSVSSLLQDHPSVKAESIGVITSAFHMKRTAQTLRKSDIAFCTLPTQYMSNTRIPPPWILPTRSTIGQMDLVLHEVVGLLWYRVRGHASW